MFVMNIGVDWDTRLMYDDAIGGLKTCNVNGNNSSSTMEEEDDEGRGRHNDDDDVNASMPDRIPPHHHDVSTTANTATATATTTSENKNVYYSVFCSYCRLELAALDMNDEIYYFFGCIASS